MKAADQGLVDKMSFRFLITGEEDDDQQQPHRSKYFPFSIHVTLFIDRVVHSGISALPQNERKIRYPIIYTFYS